MIGFLPKCLLIAVFIAAASSLLPSCKKRIDAVKSDLGEAGYELTADDWFRASGENNVSVLKKFVSSGFSTDTRDAKGDTALHAAAEKGAQDSAEFLLNGGVNVDVTGDTGRTPLMAAVIGNQTEMVRWLLRQGADPQLRDKDGFRPLMLSVREGGPGSVGELAAYDREDLDPALLLAALLGQPEVIDALTNYGASVYARMEDGRTPLMVAAENGHLESVKLLLEIGSSRYTKDPEGRTAADLATEAGHVEIAAMISRDPLPGELGLESNEQIAESMDTFVDAAIQASGDLSGTVEPPTHSASVPIEGETLSRAVVSHAARPTSGEQSASTEPDVSESFPMPPLVMRHYQEREVPVSVESVQDQTATLRIAGPHPREVKVSTGDSVPGSDLLVVRVQRRMEDSKFHPNGDTEISVVELRDAKTGVTREWIAGVPSRSHDPVALVEDAATGKRYITSAGQRFTAADGSEFLITDVRPNQLVIQDISSGSMRTISLRGPRG
jgi:hypothetical protein